MEDNFRNLHELLQDHSDKVKQWITFLNDVQSNIAGEDGCKCANRSIADRCQGIVRLISTKRKTYKSHPEEAPKPRRSTSVDQDFIDTTAEIIEDTRLRIKILERIVKELLKSMQGPFKVKPEPEKEHPEHPGTEEAPLPVVQVYDHGDYAKDVAFSLMDTLKDQFVLAKVHQLTDIDKSKPLLILCQSTSRLQPDLNYALEEFDTLDDLHASVVVVHSVAEHALQETSSQLKVAGEERYKNINLIDVAFTNELKFYQCDMNLKAFKRLKDFVSSTEATPGQSV